MTYIQQTSISQSSGGWEVQDQGASRFSVWLGPASWFIDTSLLALSAHGRRNEGALESLKSNDSIQPHDLIISQRSHPT